MMTDNHAHKVVADHYGYENQRLKLIEECGELIQALAQDSQPDIVEAMADVGNLMIQIAYLMKTNKLIHKTMEEKLKYLMEKLFDGAF